MKEEDIRPEKLLSELLKLTKVDIERYFNNAKSLAILCPACNSQGTFSFIKNGFEFEECECKTLYMSPRPNIEHFNAYYANSESSKYWATTFYKATEKNRREMLWKPKAKMINDKIKTFAPNSEIIIDIGGGYGIFIEEFLKLCPLDHLIIEPSEYLSKVCQDKGLKVLVNFLENSKKNNLPNGKKTFVSFELLEHLHDPKLFLNKLHNLMSKNDIFIFTTLNGMGIDIRTLWEKSKAVIPPMHINFLNPKSVNTLLQNIGFKVLEISTPGKIDIDIMNNNKKNIKDKFWKDFLEYSNIEEQTSMQKYMSKNLLSSHMMIVCQKVE